MVQEYESLVKLFMNTMQHFRIHFGYVLNEKKWFHQEPNLVLYKADGALEMLCNGRCSTDLFCHQSNIYKCIVFISRKELFITMINDFKGEKDPISLEWKTLNYFKSDGFQPSLSEWFKPTLLWRLIVNVLIDCKLLHFW